jgi:Transcriptional regulator PadR-like family
MQWLLGDGREGGMITLPAYLAILIVSTLVTVILVQWLGKSSMGTTLTMHAITWELLKGESTALNIMETYRRLYHTEPSRGRLYRLLDFLVERGTIARRVGEIAPERGNQPRIYYRFTEGNSAAA